MSAVSLRWSPMGAESTPLPTSVGLSIELNNSGSGTPGVLVVHGFTQTRRCLGPLATALTQRGTLLAVDAPGHGDSAQFAEANLEVAASLLADVIATSQTATGTVPMDVVGYSMGGRMSLQLAVDHPELVRRLILIGATAGIEDPIARAERAAADDANATRLIDIGVERFVQEWLSGPLFSGLEPWAQFTSERLTNTAAGLAGSLRNAGTGAMTPLWDRLAEVTIPVLCIAGERDAKFCTAARRLASALPHGRLAIIPDSGHAAHLEQPAAVIAEVTAFLDE